MENRNSNYRTDAELYIEMIESGWAPRDAVATIDAGILPFGEWKETHGWREGENSNQAPPSPK